jgi:ABC-2 type transport system permease protein
MDTVKLFPRLVWFEAQRFKTYPLEGVANIMERALDTTLFITFWLMVGRYSGSGGLSPRDIIGYYLIIGGLTPFFYTGFGIAGVFTKLIKNGELNQLLIRPVNVLVYPWATRAGKNIVNQICAGIQVIVGCFVADGHLHGSQYLLFIPVVLNMFFINAAFNVLLGTMAFYYTEVKGFQSTAVHISRLLRGEVMPLYLMPIGLFHFLQWTPFPASAYHLTGLLQGNHRPTLGQIAIGCAWSVLLIGLAKIYWNKGLRRYEAIGL